MAVIYVPANRFQAYAVGASSIANPILFMKIGTTFYGSGYIINYPNGGFRHIFPYYDPSDSNIYIGVFSAANVAQNLPELSLSNIVIYGGG